MATAFVDPGALVLVSSPCYPCTTSDIVQRRKKLFLPLTKKIASCRNLGAIPADVARAAKMLWINYPNNPTRGAEKISSRAWSSSRTNITSSSVTTPPIPRWASTAIALELPRSRGARESASNFTRSRRAST